MTKRTLLPLFLAAFAMFIAAKLTVEILDLEPVYEVSE